MWRGEGIPTPQKPKEFIALFNFRDLMLCASMYGPAMLQLWLRCGSGTAVHPPVFLSNKRLLHWSTPGGARFGGALTIRTSFWRSEIGRLTSTSIPK